MRNGIEKKMKIILTRATGMIGEGVLLASLDHPKISEVLIAWFDFR